MSDVDNKELRPPIGPYNLTVLNVDLNSGERLEGAEFELIAPGYSEGEGEVQVIGDKDVGVFYILQSLAGAWKIKQTKASTGYQLNSTPIVINVERDAFEVVGAQESDWYDFNPVLSVLSVKNSPRSTDPELKPESQPEGGTKMKIATDNSLKELIKLVKSQPSTSSGGILNVTLDYTIPSYSPVEVETKRKRVYADIPCVNSKVAMNAQITPNDNIENVSLLTYAEPFDGYIRCYFSEQPTESYIIDSVELTPVTSIVKKK